MPQRLDESARKRDASPRGVPAQWLGELEREVDRLLRELGEVCERSQADGDQQQQMRDETERLRAELDEA